MSMGNEKNCKYIIGIDEVGRGPLAGPVTVGAVLIPRNLKISNIIKLRDSKKLTQKSREEWFAYIKSNSQIFFATTSVSAEMIDKIGIQRATSRALAHSLSQTIRTSDVRMGEIEIMLDGSLYAPQKYKNQKTIIKGDEKISAISLASIVAKVTRDRKMIKFSKKYPEYGFDVHKGYGTKKHYEAIKTVGVVPIHRRSYLKKVIYNTDVRRPYCTN